MPVTMSTRRSLRTGPEAREQKRNKPKIIRPHWTNQTHRSPAQNAASDESGSASPAPAQSHSPGPGCNNLATTRSTAEPEDSTFGAQKPRFALSGQGDSGSAELFQRRYADRFGGEEGHDC